MRIRFPRPETMRVFVAHSLPSSEKIATHTNIVSTTQKEIAVCTEQSGTGLYTEYQKVPRHSLCLCVYLCLCLCQTNLHMRVASTSKQNCTRSTLPAAEEAQQQAAPQLWIPALASMSACAVSNTRSSWVLHLPTACGLHRPFAAAVATKSRSNLVPSPPSLP